MQTLSVARLFEDQRQELQLESLTESLASSREITVSDIHRPGMALMGFVENFLPERIQILAQTELTYLATLSPEQVRDAVDRLFQFSMPLIVVCKGLEVPKVLIERANERQVPVLRTTQSTTPFIHLLTSYLDHMFAPQTTVHGSLVDVYGTGLLFTGSSAIGKSETALDLVERGHRLVADDVVTITRRHGDVLIGTGNQLLRHHMEIRGLGIIDVQSIFGIRSIRLQKRVEVEVNLAEWSASEDYERVGLDEHKSSILGVEIPMVQVPITPGKNITVIGEVIALNYLVKVYGGYSPAERLNQHLIELMKRKSAARAWVREDTE
ncbi:MAG: HPr kinase/phosphorylase [Candidatus Eisenbacteria bacterium]|uniref:HPr kinase/phosphorylase n=1 Tax=Eiseniibacteriota bacterium TaxID=2212470 RepID=A0A9D6QJ57_UNCEI|nr:HPr kinase/phosphorylase [Candidatus Eisenbacteria bacterium]MBI3540172.1 HPr kinase/phosphorylase [Candidatus Eisenbacteria bacterium]